jgi:uncharacterized coiled-coil DUF342 family protein
MRRLLFFCIIGTLMIFISTGFAQIYGYVDHEGNVRFTDNPVNVPDEWQENMKIMEEIKTTPGQHQETGETSQEKDYAITQHAEPAINDQIIHELNSDNQLRDVREKLALERAEIQTLYDQIEEEKKKLGDQLPESASPVERRVYHQQILDLNQRIEDYQKRAEAYREKVEAFNANSMQ